MNYDIDLSKISLMAYKEILKTQYLLPSRRVLLQNVDYYFDSLAKHGINNLQSLKEIFSSKKRFNQLIISTGLKEDLMIILKREIGSLAPSVVKISDFLYLDEGVLTALKTFDILNSRDYYSLFLENRLNSDFFSKIRLDETRAIELFELCDLVRINGVGAIAAKSFLDAGYHSVYDVANTTASKMLERVSRVNDIYHYYKTKLGIKDMQFCIDYAKLIIRLEKEGEDYGI